VNASAEVKEPNWRGGGGEGGVEEVEVIEVVGDLASGAEGLLSL